MTITEYLKRGSFHSSVRVEIQPYTGVLAVGGGVGVDGLLTWAAAVDVTDDIRDINIDISEGIVDLFSSGNGQLQDKITLVLNNLDGKYDYNGPVFNGYFINNSRVKITSTYYTYERDITGALIPTEVSHRHYYGLLKRDSSSFSVTGKDRCFSAGILGIGQILNCLMAVSGGSSTTLKARVQSVLATVDDGETGTPNYTFASIFHDNVFGTISPPWEFGIKHGGVEFDPYIIDANILSNWGTRKFIDVLNEVCILTLSVWRIGQSGEILIEPINNDGASVWDLEKDDVLNIDELTNNPLQYTAINWDDGTTPLTVKMLAVDRGSYGYDLFQKSLTANYIQTTNGGIEQRQEILDQLLVQYQHAHRLITLTTKNNPTLEINQIITINLPAESGRNSLIIDPFIKWRIITIKRNLCLTPDMQIIAVQAGTGVDANLDGT